MQVNGQVYVIGSENIVDNSGGGTFVTVPVAVDGVVPVEVEIVGVGFPLIAVVAGRIANGEKY